MTLWPGLGNFPDGEIVSALAEKALGKKQAKEHFKEKSSTALVEGEVLAANDARSITVRWSYPGGQFVGKHARKALIGLQQEASARKQAEPNVSERGLRGTEAELCSGQVDNEEERVADGMGSRKRKQKGDKELDSDGKEPDGCFPHILRPVRQLYGQEEDKQKQRRCFKCHVKCNLYCVICSAARGKILSMCCPSTGRDCMIHHLYR